MAQQRILISTRHRLDREALGRAVRLAHPAADVVVSEPARLGPNAAELSPDLVVSSGPAPQPPGVPVWVRIATAGAGQSLITLFGSPIPVYGLRLGTIVELVTVASRGAPG